MPILKDAYQKIVDDVLEPVRSSYVTNSGTMERIALCVAHRCQALAEPKPVKRLNDEQIYEIWDAASDRHTRAYCINKIIDAHIKLQQEPEEVAYSEEALKSGNYNLVVHYIGGQKNEKRHEFYEPVSIELVRKS